MLNENGLNPLRLVATVLSASPAPHRAELMQFFLLIDEQADHMRGLIADLLDQGRIEAGTLSVSVEPGGGRRPGGPGAEHVPERRRPARPAHRPAGGPAAGHRRPGAHRLGLEQPVLQRGETLSRACTSRSRSPTRAGVCRPTNCRTCSGSMPIRPAEIENVRAGCGLGLTICKGLVEEHGGRIWAEGRGSSRGTRIAFTVPVGGRCQRSGPCRAGRSRPAAGGPAEDAHRGGRRRPADDTVRSRGAPPGRLRAGRDGRPGGGAGHP